MRVVFASMLLASAFAGCFTTDPSGFDDDTGVDPSLGRLSTAEWKAQLSSPVFDAIDSAIHRVKAADGTLLTLTLHLPRGLPSDAKVPTVIQITPYQTFIFPHVVTPATGIPPPGSGWASQVLRGAAYVEADARGTNGSEGCLDFGGSLDRSDAEVFIEWIRAQAWSNGIVVSDGVSHPGMGSVVAHVASPALTAALAHAPVVSYYQDEWLQGAKFEDQGNGPAYQGVEASPPVSLDPETIKAQAASCTGKTTVDFGGVDGPFTPVWQDRDLSLYTQIAEASRVPILLTQGFVDQNVHPDHVQKYWDALPADYPKSMILGYWYHGYPDMDGHPAEKFSDIRQRWFDATLFGAANALTAEPRVLVEDSKGGWHESDDWPLAPSEHITLHASPEGGLAMNVTAEQEGLSYADSATAKRGTWLNAHVAFRTEPLASAKLVNGAPEVDLVASSTATSTKWVVYLLDEAPDGSWQRISHGYADSHSWSSPPEWRDIEPGIAYSWTVKLMPTAVVVEEGHRVVLVIASADSRRTMEDGPCFSDYRGGCYRPSGILPAASSGVAINTVRAGGEDGTRLHLAWVDPALTAKPPA